MYTLSFRYGCTFDRDTFGRHGLCFKTRNDACLGDRASTFQRTFLIFQGGIQSATVCMYALMYVQMYSVKRWVCIDLNPSLFELKLKKPFSPLSNLKKMNSTIGSRSQCGVVIWARVGFPGSKFCVEFGYRVGPVGSARTSDLRLPHWFITRDCGEQALF